MKFRPSWVDLTYQAQFSRVLFELAAAPVKILAAIHKVMPVAYGITSADLSVVPGTAISDVHAKVRLFNGNASIDVTADSLSAQFNNPVGPDDGAIIQNCLRLALEALAEAVGHFDIKEETVTLRMFAELIGQPDAHSFLRQIAGQQHLYPVVGAAESGSQMVPNLQFELINDSDRWSSYWSIARAIRSPKEVFISTTTRFLLGSKFADINQKADHIRGLFTDFLGRIGLQPEPKAT